MAWRKYCGAWTDWIRTPKGKYMPVEYMPVMVMPDCIDGVKVLQLTDADE